MTIPTVRELIAQSEVVRALEAAWADSFADDELLRHEEGGWIYFQPQTCEITTRRAPRGELDFIVLGHPIVIPGWYIVGMFHTHPNPTATGWNPEPSPDDRRLHLWAGVPVIVVEDREWPNCSK